MKVLVVDDNKLITHMVKSYLSSFFSAQVEIAVNGQKGYDLFKQKQFDLIITDYNMPVLGGIDLVRRIREVNQNVKIIAYSIFDYDEDRDKMLEAGVNVYILKDGDIQPLMNAISELLPEFSK